MQPHDIPEFDPVNYPDHELASPATSVEFISYLNPKRVHIATISPRVNAKDQVAVRGFHWPKNRTDIRAHIEQLALYDTINVYYCPNEATFTGNDMPGEDDITRLNAIVIDIDPLATTSEEGWLSERYRIKKLVHAERYSALKPSYITDTGNGAQLVYFIHPVENSQENRAKYLAIAKALTYRIGGDPATAHNVKQLFRVPGTRNAPNQSKKDRGRHAVPGGTWHVSELRYDLDDLYQQAAKDAYYPEDEDSEYPADRIDGLTFAMLVEASANLEHRVDEAIRSLFMQSDSFHNLYLEVKEGRAKDRSKADFQFCLELLEVRMPPADVACALAHYGAQKAQPVGEKRWESYIVRTVLHASKGTRKPAEDWYDNSGDENVEAEQPKPGGERRWKLASELKDAAFNTPSPLVKEFLPRTGPVLLFGPSNSGKSLVALELCSCVASNTPFAGLPVKETAGLVVYIVLEGRGGMAKRVAALESHFPDRDHHRLRFLMEEFDLFIVDRERKHPHSLAGLIKELQGMAKQAATGISMIVLDVLNSVAGDADENSVKDMAVVMENIKRLGEFFNCCTVTVHHSGKDVRKGSRGSSVIRTKSDTEIEVIEGSKGGTLVVRKQRDIEFDKARGVDFAIRSVPLGKNAEGDEINGGIALMGAVNHASYSQPLTDAELKVMAFMRALGRPCTQQEIADALLTSMTSVRNLVKSLSRKKCLFQRTPKTTGKYGKPATYELYDYEEPAEQTDDQNDPFAE